MVGFVHRDFAQFEHRHTRERMIKFTARHQRPNQRLNHRVLFIVRHKRYAKL